MNGDAIQQPLRGVVVTQAIKTALFVCKGAVQQLGIFQVLPKWLVPVINFLAIKPIKAKRKINPKILLIIFYHLYILNIAN